MSAGLPSGRSRALTSQSKKPATTYPAAITTLARLGETYPDFDLGLFIGLDDEWNGGWGRLEPDLKAAAEQEIDHILHSPH